jgi:hypothetical protein
MSKIFDKEALRSLKKQLEKQAIEQSKFLFNRNIANKDSDLRVYWPSRENPVLWAYKHSEAEMFRGLELWLQHLYDIRPNEMPRRPINGFDGSKARFRFWSMLSDKWNQGNLTIEFIETD